MSAASCRRGRAAARKARRVEELFDQYLDHVLDGVAQLGVEPAMAMDAIFTAATYLAEQCVLPVFPGTRASAARVGSWMIAAAEFDFATFMVKSVLSVADPEGVSS